MKPDIEGTPKNHKKRTVPFPRFPSEPLARQPEGKGREDHVFPGDNGHHLRLARVHEDNMSWFAGAVKCSTGTWTQFQTLWTTLSRWQVWANGPAGLILGKRTAPLPLQMKGCGAVLSRGDGGI